MLEWFDLEEGKVMGTIDKSLATLRSAIFTLGEMNMDDNEWRNLQKIFDKKTQGYEVSFINLTRFGIPTLGADYIISGYTFEMVSARTQKVGQGTGYSRLEAFLLWLSDSELCMTQWASHSIMTLAVVFSHKSC